MLTPQPFTTPKYFMWLTKLNPLNIATTAWNSRKEVPYTRIQSVFVCHVGHSCLCEDVWEVAPPSSIPPCPPNFKFVKKRKREGVGQRGREGLPKGLLHRTTSAVGRAQTRPSCQRETNEERPETIHKPHPLQGRFGLTGWKSGCTGALNARFDSNKHKIKDAKVFNPSLPLVHAHMYVLYVTV